MSFANAPVSKGLMMFTAVSSLVAGIFDIKHFLQLQLVPHLSKYHQYWRLLAHHLAFSDSSHLFVAEIIFFYVGVHIERRFGSVKFASFALVTTLVGTIIELASLMLFNRFGLNYIPSGPIVLVYAILYQHFRIVPATYHFRVFGVPLSNKSFHYLLACQLMVSRSPGSLAAAVIGLLAGQLYRSDVLNLKSYRLPLWFIRLSSRLLLPMIGSLRPPRRTTRAFPTTSRTSSASPATDGYIQPDIQATTTARPDSAADLTTRIRNLPEAPANETGAPNSSVVREWVDELTGRAERENAGLRVPSEAEINQLTTMFPDLSRQVVIGALQRSPNIEMAVETLLSNPGGS